MNEDTVQWTSNESDNIYDSAIVGRNILTVDQQGTKVTLWWLAFDDDLRRHHRRAPDHFVIAAKAWLHAYQGIPFSEYIGKMFVT